MRILVLLLISLSVLILANANDELRFLEEKIEGCWLSAYGRGVGKPIRTCNGNLEKDGLLCYPRCEEGYGGVGPVCWQDCKNGFRDDGAYCAKPEPYGRGAGYALWSQDQCSRENPQGCEQWGLMYYPKCSPGFHNVACCICSPDCPSDQNDIGVSCQKNSYGRTAGTPLECESDEQYDAGLCYTPCQNNYKNVGPVCWGYCPAGYTPCGALCLKNQTCSDQIKQYFDGVIDIISAFAQEKNAEGVIDIGKFSKDFIFDVCK